MPITITRIDPRADKDDVLHLTQEYYAWQKLPFDLKHFELELNNRIADLKQRNGIILAKEDGKLVGLGFFTVYKNFLNQDECVIHKMITRKEDSFKKGIEEAIFRELMKYVKNIFGITKFTFRSFESDMAYVNMLMKLGIKKASDTLYEKVIE
jgi:RimJ/RimL family protein N-acetyltransferase